MTWPKIKSKSKRYEIRWLCLIVAILTFGIVDEIYGHFAAIHNWPLFIVDDYDSVSSMVISIQATVATLVITVLSLMTNKMEKAILGVSVNNFLLNIKPQIFKQKRIIISEIILIIANVFIYMIGWYNIACAVFIVGMILVLISILEIYEAFLGTEKIDGEIEAYVTYINQNGSHDNNNHDNGSSNSGISTDSSASKSENNPDVVQKLIDLTAQWKNDIANQSDNEYERYLNVFNLLFSYAFSTDEDRKVLLTQCVEISRALFDDKTDVASLRGIDFVSNCYNQVWLYIKDHQEEIKQSRTKFYLLTETYEDFMDAFYQTDIQKIERSDFRWWIFAENIIQDALYMGPEDDDSAESKITDESASTVTNGKKEDKLLNPFAIPDIHTVSDFCYYLGSIIANTFDPEARVKINVKEWSRPLRTVYLGGSYPEDLQPIADKAVSECYFNFMIAQVRNGRYEIITEWYKYLGQYANWKENDDFAYIAIKLHCYIYYLAFYENDSCADERVIKAAKDFIQDKSNLDIKSDFKAFIEASAERDKNVFPDAHYGSQTIPLNIFNSDLITRLRMELRRYEFMPGDFVAKRLVMDDVVLDFVTYLACYICNVFHGSEVLDSIISEEESSVFYSRFDETDHTNDLKDFFVLMGMPDEDIVIINTDVNNNTKSEKAPCEALSKAQATYAVLIDTIEEKYKNWSIDQAHKAPKISSAEYGKQKGKAIETLQKYFKDNFKGLIDEHVEDDADSTTVVEKYRLNLARFKVFTDTKVDMLVTGNLDQFFISFTNFLANVLLNDKRIDETDKKDFSSEQWLEYLKGQQDKIFIGSEFMLYPSDWKYRQPVNAVIKNTEHYTNGIYGLTLILNKGSIKLNFKNPRVGIRTETIDEAVGKNNAKPDASGKYRYAPSVGMAVNFSEEELQQYLKDKRKVVDVSIGVEIAITGDKIGTVIEEG